MLPSLDKKLTLKKGKLQTDKMKITQCKQEDDNETI